MPTYHYKPGTVRWRRHNPKHGDVRGVRVPDGWAAMAEQRDTHPITGRHFRAAEWWIKETREDDDE